jgi:hypothetical protein
MISRITFALVTLTCALAAQPLTIQQIESMVHHVSSDPRCRLLLVLAVDDSNHIEYDIADSINALPYPHFGIEDLLPHYLHERYGLPILDSDSAVAFRQQFSDSIKRTLRPYHLSSAIPSSNPASNLRIRIYEIDSDYVAVTVDGPMKQMPPGRYGLGPELYLRMLFRRSKSQEMIPLALSVTYSAMTR